MARKNYGKIKSRDTFYIITNGEKTEWNYFNLLKKINIFKLFSFLLFNIIFNFFSCKICIPMTGIRKRIRIIIFNMFKRFRC